MSVETIPILPSRDFDRTAAFYSVLGFVEAARYPGEYLIVLHALGVELHFWSNPALDPAANDAGCYLRFSSAAGARSLFDRWAELDLGAGTLTPPDETDYNLLEFALLDCDRNLLRIGGFIEEGGRSS